MTASKGWLDACTWTDMLVLREACGVVQCAASPTSTTRPHTHCCRGSLS